MRRLNAPKQPAPDHFDLVYFVHCMAYLEQEDRLLRQRIKRIVRVGTTLIVSIAIVLLVGCNPVRAVPPIPPIAPQIAPKYKCDRADSFWCVLKPNWRVM